MAMLCKKNQKIHAVSLTPHARCMRCIAKYGTACTIVERFERSWQPLKGIYIFQKLLCSRIGLPPTLQKIEIKRGYQTKNFRASGVIHTACTIFAFENALARESGAQGTLFDLMTLSL
jgi:hypothetical protein